VGIGVEAVGGMVSRPWLLARLFVLCGVVCGCVANL